MSVIKAFASLRICLFCYVFSWNPVKHFSCSVVNNGLQVGMSTADKELVPITFVGVTRKV